MPQLRKAVLTDPHRVLTLGLAHYSCVLRLRWARCASAWWARRQTDHAMMRAGWIRRCASFIAMRRIS